MTAPYPPLPPPRPRKSRPRNTHVIRPNARAAVPRHRAYVDTEAVRTSVTNRVERQTLAFGWCCFERTRATAPDTLSHEQWLRFSDAEDWWLALDAAVYASTALHVYAHNLDYDAALLRVATLAPAHGWELLEWVLAKKLLWITLRRGKQTVYLINTQNYFDTSLAELGTSLGVQKLPMPRAGASQDRWDAYCRQDVAILRAAMHAFYRLLREHDLGGYRKTAAMQAYAAWRHRFMTHRCLVIANNDLSAFERTSYHGGRSEVFYDRPIRTGVFALDVNSMFPAVMAAHSYPARCWKTGTLRDTDELRLWLSRGCVTARVTLTTEEPCYPYAAGDRVLFPVGTFDATLTTPELVYALARGHITALGRYAAYEAKPLFRSYVETLYTLRLRYRSSGNIAFAYLLKLLLNALYGKFGQRGYKWVDCHDPAVPGLVAAIGNCTEGGPALHHRLRLGRWLHRLDDAEAYESMPAVAAHVTAYARMELWRLIGVAGRQHVYYCDTDSLYVDRDGYRALAGEIHPTRLGALKLEAVVKSAQFRAPKDYSFGNKQRVKQIRRSARQLGRAEYEQAQFEGYDAVIERGADGEILVTTVTKRITRVNHQSLGNGIGWRAPLRIPPADAVCGADSP